jgi:8-oxo-dGTP pyrophosphatase MutT (NUDIX family)
LGSATGNTTILHFTFHNADVPDERLVTGVVVVPFADGKCIMADVRNREGHEFTAGHTEPGETPEQTAERELKEETGAVPTSLSRVGHVLVHNDDKPIKEYPFPDSFLVVFAATCGVQGVGMNLTHESDGVLVCHPDEATQHLKFNRQLYLDMLQAARAKVGA